MAGIKARTLYDFASKNLGELQFVSAETLTVTDQNVGDGWWEAVNSSGKRGLVPAAYLEIISSPEPVFPQPPSSVVQSSSSKLLFRSHTVTNGPANHAALKPNSLNPSHIPSHSRPPPPYSKFQRSETLPEPDTGDFWDDDWDDDDDEDDEHCSTATNPNNGVYVRESFYSSLNEKRMKQSPMHKGDSRTIAYNPFNNFAQFTKIGGDSYLFGSSTLSPQHRSTVLIVDGPDGLMWKLPDNPYKCSIASPKKETKYHGIKTFTTYQLTPSFSGIQVSRRYNHFLWIQSCLVEKFPTLVIPPLPERHFVGRFEQGFVKMRLRLLQLWIDRLCQHPVIADSNIFKHFLTCTDQKVWSEVKRKAKKDELSGARFFLIVRAPVLDSMHADTNINRFHRYSKILDDDLKHLNSTGENSMKKHEGSFKKHFLKLGGSFMSLSKSFEQDERSSARELTMAVSHTGKTYQEIGQMFAKQPSEDMVLLLEGIQEYRGLLSCFSSSIAMHKAAAAKINEQSTILDEVELKSLQERANVVSSTVLAEIQHFNQHRVGDFKHYMQNYLQSQINFYHEIASKLEGTLKQYGKA